MGRSSVEFPPDQMAAVRIAIALRAHSALGNRSDIRFDAGNPCLSVGRHSLGAQLHVAKTVDDEQLQDLRGRQRHAYSLRLDEENFDEVRLIDFGGR